MRSYNNLYEPMLQDDYIKQCFEDAAKKKKKRNDVKNILNHLDEETEKLKTILQKEMFVPDYHELSVINDGNKRKTRRILKPHYKYEQVVHHCAIGQFKQIVTNGLYEFSCGSIPDRGVHYGKKYMRKWIDSYGGKKMYVLKMDVHHFFESIDREVLKEKLRKVIRDKRFLRLLCIFVEYDRIAEVVKILEYAAVEITEQDVRDLVTHLAFHNDENALTIIRKTGITGNDYTKIEWIVREHRKGVPLGYFTSQWFGNFYLKALDHYIKEVLKAKHYMRYMDDMVILGRSKKKLHKMRLEIARYLKEELDLELKDDWQVFRFEYPIMKNGIVVRDEKGKSKTRGRMLDFMGFKFHYDRTTIRKTTLESARKKAYHIAKNDKISWYNATVMLSYLGWFKHTDTYEYYLKYIKPNVNVKKLKRIVSKHSRKEQEHERMEDAAGNAGGTPGGDRPGIIADDGVSA